MEGEVRIKILLSHTEDFYPEKIGKPHSWHRGNGRRMYLIILTTTQSSSNMIKCVGYQRTSIVALLAARVCVCTWRACMQLIYIVHIWLLYRYELSLCVCTTLLHTRILLCIAAIYNTYVLLDHVIMTLHTNQQRKKLHIAIFDCLIYDAYYSTMYCYNSALMLFNSFLTRKINSI